jgi:hypothetical protein
VSRPLSRRTLSLVLIAVTAMSCAPRAGAQAVLYAKSATVLRDEYMADLDTVHVKIMVLANAIPEEKYSWRPAPGVRSVSEVLMHVATEYYFYVPGSVGGKPPADFGPPRETIPKKEKITAKAEVIAELNTSWAYANAQLGAADPSALTGIYNAVGGVTPQGSIWHVRRSARASRAAHLLRAVGGGQAAVEQVERQPQTLTATAIRNCSTRMGTDDGQIYADTASGRPRTPSLSSRNIKE